MPAWQDFLQYEPVDEQLNDERRRLLRIRNEERLIRHDILLLDITNTLAKLRLLFREHDESKDSSCKGVFFEIVKLIAR